MPRLSRNEIEEQEENSMSTIYKHDGQYTREELAANTVPVYAHPAPLTNVQLGALRDESRRLQRPLSDAEREAVLGLTPEQRPSVRVIEVQ
jgi:hypothetical protein